MRKAVSLRSARHALLKPSSQETSMRARTLFSLIVVGFIIVFSLFSLQYRGDAQQRGGLTPEQIAQRNQREQELEAIAVIDRKVMVPMRDGKRMAADIYRPKDTSR